MRTALEPWVHALPDEGERYAKHFRGAASACARATCEEDGETEHAGANRSGPRADPQLFIASMRRGLGKIVRPMSKAGQETSQDVAAHDRLSVTDERRCAVPVHDDRAQ